MSGSANNVIKRWKGAVQPAAVGWTQDEISGGTRTRTEGAVSLSGTDANVIYLHKGAVQTSLSTTTPRHIFGVTRSVTRGITRDVTGQFSWH